MIPHNLFNTVLIIPTLNILVLFIHIFQNLHLPGAFGFAIITLVLLVRFILHPVFVRQMETQKKMSDLKPHMDRLAKMHKKDPKKHQEEQMKLYKEHGINPAAGCFTMIIQLPIFIGLYSTLSLFLQKGTSAHVISEVNKVLYVSAIRIYSIDPNFFGFNLAAAPNKFGPTHWYYFLVPVITAALQYAQARFATPMMGATPEPASEPDTAKSGKLAKKGAEDKKPDTSGDFQKALNMQMKYFFPLMIGYFSFSLPVGLSLYWNIFSIFSILQYRRVNGAKSE